MRARWVARYCGGHAGEVGFGSVSSRPGSKFFSERRWHIFDARNNVPRIGRVLIGCGRDATDVPLSTTFGPNILKSFKVWTDEVQP